jgi:hypothetical protein
LENVGVRAKHNSRTTAQSFGFCGWLELIFAVNLPILHISCRRRFISPDCELIN